MTSMITAAKKTTVTSKVFIHQCLCVHLPFCPGLSQVNIYALKNQEQFILKKYPNEINYYFCLFPLTVSKGETFRSYINLKDLDPPAAFPPDKDSPMSPPPSGHSGQPPVEKPPKVTSLPFQSNTRSASVASSIKSRSIFYNSV